MATKKFIFLVSILLSMGGTKALADSFTVKNADGVNINYYFADENETELGVTFGAGYKGSVVVPETVEYEGKKYRVTCIGGGAFKDCSNLTSITIPSSVTSIGMMAFGGCSSLTSVNIPDGVTSIEDYTFKDCASLTSITIPDGVTSIGESAFSRCFELTSVTIPNSVTSIGDWALFGCISLTSLNIPDGVTSIGEGAFRSCEGLTSVTIGNGVIIIRTSAFSECSGLTSVTMGNSVASIGESAFDGCISLTSITIPGSVKSIGYRAFCSCQSLPSITIPSSVTTIGEMAFNDCTSLNSINIEAGNTKYDSREDCNAIIETKSNKLIIGCQNTTIPNSVTSIGNHAFDNCSGLMSITIPNSVTSIGEYAFIGCNMLQEIISKIENPFTIGTTTFTNYDAALYVPEGTIDKYKATEGWKDFVNIQEGTPSSIIKIEDNGANEIKRYTIHGRVIRNSHKGINIIQMNNGTTKKVVIK